MFGLFFLLVIIVNLKFNSVSNKTPKQFVGALMTINSLFRNFFLSGVANLESVSASKFSTIIL